VRVRVPQRCKFCDGLTTVSPETTIERGLVRLAWHCRACDSEWPITRGETNQLIGRRRSGVADRRRRTRTDRRTE
jgi:hypothetical protein